MQILAMFGLSMLQHLPGLYEFSHPPICIAQWQ